MCNYVSLKATVNRHVLHISYGGAFGLPITFHLSEMNISSVKACMHPMAPASILETSYSSLIFRSNLTSLSVRTHKMTRLLFEVVAACTGVTCTWHRLTVCICGCRWKQSVCRRGYCVSNQGQKWSCASGQGQKNNQIVSNSGVKSKKLPDMPVCN